MDRLTNTVRPYAWGSTTAIAELKRLIQEDGLILSTGMHNACGATDTVSATQAEADERVCQTVRLRAEVGDGESRAVALDRGPPHDEEVRAVEGDVDLERLRTLPAFAETFAALGLGLEDADKNIELCA